MFEVPVTSSLSQNFGRAIMSHLSNYSLTISKNNVWHCQLLSTASTMVLIYCQLACRPAQDMLKRFLIIIVHRIAAGKSRYEVLMQICSGTAVIFWRMFHIREVCTVKKKLKINLNCWNGNAVLLVFNLFCCCSTAMDEIHAQIWLNTGRERFLIQVIAHFGYWLGFQWIFMKQLCRLKTLNNFNQNISYISFVLFD